VIPLHAIDTPSASANMGFPGTTVDAQWYGRDLDLAPPNSTIPTDGLRFVFCI
jgi:hypothetical protein